MSSIAQPLSFIGFSQASRPGAQLPDSLSGREPDAPILGALTNEQPITLLPGDTQLGNTGRATVDDYYNAIHVKPALIDVGRLTSTARRQVEVWNAYFTPRELVAIDVEGGDGILTAGPSAPRTFGVLEAVTYTLDITPDGPSVINARFSFDFTDVTTDPHWRVVGTRIIEWTLPPNWTNPVEETWEYRTEILTANDGSEQRIAMRHLPRQYFSFSPVLAGDRDREGKRLLSTWQNRAFAMANWTRGVSIAPVPVGADTVLLDESIPELVEGGLLVLRHQDTSAVLEIEEINGLLIRLNSPITQGFPAGSKAYPGLTLHADPSLSGRRMTSQVSEVTMQFRKLYEPGELTIEPPGLTWRGKEVVLRRHNWAEEVDVQHNWEFVWLDSDRGAYDFRTPISAPADVRRFSFLMRNRDEARDLLAFFTRCRGRRQSFYLPTWEDDLPYRRTGPLVQGSSRYPVDGADAQRMTSERVYRNLCIRLTDGTILLRSVFGPDADAEGPVLVLTETWPRTIEAHEILAVHWMPLCRLAADEIVLRWASDSVAQTTLPFVVLPDDEGT